MTQRILVTHTGRLSSSLREFEPLDLRVGRGEACDAAAYAAMKRRAIRDVVRKQLEVGVDIVSDGELGRRRDFAYYSRRIGGIELRDLKPGEVGATIMRSRERLAFPDYYAEADATRPAVARPRRMVCSAPLRSLGLGDLEQEIAEFKAALPGTETAAFFPVIAPGWIDHFIFNEHYRSDEEFVFALAEVMRPEYKAVIDAGLVLQIDDPGLADAWPTFIPQPPLEDYRRYARTRVEALNHALRGLPPERLRYHLCWGSWHGPHTEDIALRDIVDLLLEVNVGAYSVEAGNVRHEHEWKVWRDVRLPEGKVLIPGVVSHKTSAVEHPELVADRLLNYARLVGREHVQAGTDCGMGLGRVHHEVGWAKLQALVDGAGLASRELWGA
jgi:5-methyltetrahydropteroyltriglutamate--homocysteine methyltransferase